jgi:DNA invertase Pin-like site-specific DNA recombinase
MKKAVIYVRFNTQDSTTGDVQLAQETALRDYAVQRSWEVVGVYRDPFVPGNIPQGGPAWREFLADAGRVKPDVLLVRDITRPARPIQIMVERLAELQRLGISLVGIQDGMEYSPAQMQSLLSMLGGLRKDFAQEASRQSGRDAM